MKRKITAAPVVDEHGRLCGAINLQDFYRAGLFNPSAPDVSPACGGWRRPSPAPARTPPSCGYSAPARGRSSDAGTHSSPRAGFRSRSQVSPASRTASFPHAARNGAHELPLHPRTRSPRQHHRAVNRMFQFTHVTASRSSAGASSHRGLAPRGKAPF